MKTKVEKKGKKRSLSETSHPPKSHHKQKDAVKSQNSPKKPKLADTERNGKLMHKTKELVLKKIHGGPLEKRAKKAKQQNSAAASPKQEMKTHAKGNTKFATSKTQKEGTTKTDVQLKLLKKRQEERALGKEKRKQKAGIELSVEVMESRIEAIMSREALSRTAKKKVAILKRKLKVMKRSGEGEAEQENDEVASQKESGKTVQSKNKKAANDQKMIAGEKELVLYVQNLPADTTEDEVKQLFLTRSATVTNIQIRTSPNKKRPTATAFVKLSSRTDCVKGLSLSDTLVKGKKITVQYAHSPPAFEDAAKLEVQKQKPQSKKAKHEPEEDDLIEDEEDDEDDEDEEDEEDDDDDDEDESDLEEEEDEFIDMDDSEEESDDDEDDEIVAHKKEGNKKFTSKKKEAARPFMMAAGKKPGKVVGGVQKGKDHQKKGHKMIGQKRNKLGRNN